MPVSDQPDGEPCRIVEYDTSKPGKHGAAKARIVGVGVFDGQKRPHVGPFSIQIHIQLITKKNIEIIVPDLTFDSHDLNSIHYFPIFNILSICNCSVYFLIN